MGEHFADHHFCLRVLSLFEKRGERTAFVLILLEAVKGGKVFQLFDFFEIWGYICGIIYYEKVYKV